MSARILWLGALGLALACAGCGTTVEDICEGLAECPERVGEDCVADGERLEKMADQQECDEQLEDYLDCLDQSGCDWRTTCEDRRDAISDCVGELPI